MVCNFVLHGDHSSAAINWSNTVCVFMHAYMHVCVRFCVNSLYVTLMCYVMFMLLHSVEVHNSYTVSLLLHHIVNAMFSLFYQ